MTVSQAFFRNFGLSAIMAGIVVLGFPSYAQQMSDSEQARNEKVAAAYSQHLFTSMCADNYRNEFPVGTLSAADKAQLNQHTKGACDCMYDRVKKEAEPTDVTDYVMFTYGVQSPDGIDPEALEYYGSKRVQKIGALWSDKPLLKKCGFSRKIDSLK